MASGCILGECKYCKEFIWEDENWDIEDKSFFHMECKKEFENHLTKYTDLELIMELERRKNNGI